MGKSKQELKYKRLKVGHACFVCRSKKIKCDGLRPCMQCKARGRDCQTSSTSSSLTSSNPGSPLDHSIAELSLSEDNNSSTIESDDDSILFSRSKKSITTTSTTTTPTSVKFNESWTSSNCEKDKQNDAYPTFGSFVRWRNEPELPHKYTYPIEMPSSEIQMHLIDLFFKTRYKITPMIPKRLFYAQLSKKGPIITPFLLNSIYCIVSGYSTLPDVPKPVVFYNRAKKLLDDFLDTPRVSTVAALCLLSLYEPVPTKSRNMPDQHCRSWMYSGMAFRMCLELGLNLDNSFSRSNLSLEGIEFCRRVFWSCYCLDKMQSSEWERLWALPSSLAKTCLPQFLPGDDEEERWIVLAYEQKIKLSIIAEDGLQIRASFSIRNDIPDIHLFDQVEQYRKKIFNWRENLESPELWGLVHCDSIDQIMNEPKKPAILSYINIIYYFMLTETSFYFPKSYHKNSLEQRMFASQLTKSIDILCEDPSLVIKFEFLAHATICAIRVHSLYLNDSNPEISRQSWDFFNQCVKILRKFQKYVIIPECSAVLAHLPVICEYSKEAPHSSSNCLSNDSMSSTLLYHSSPQSISELNYDATNNNVSQTSIHQQESIYNQNRSIDPYRAEIVPIRPSFDYLDSMIDTSPYNGLIAFGSTIGVDFADRRQLWDYALQDVFNDINSTDDTSLSQQTTTFTSNNSDWTSPKEPSFTWPGPIQRQHTSSPQQPLRSPPTILTSHPMHMSQTQEHQNYNISSSSHQDLGLLLCNSYQNTNMHHTYLQQQQQPQQHFNRQPGSILPLPLAYTSMSNNGLS